MWCLYFWPANLLLGRHGLPKDPSRGHLFGRLVWGSAQWWVPGEAGRAGLEGGIKPQALSMGCPLLRHSPGWRLIWIPQTCRRGGWHLVADPARYSQYLLQLIVTVPAPVIGFRNKGFWILEAQEKMRRRKHRKIVVWAFKPGSPRHCPSLGPASWFYYGHPENEVSNHRVPSLVLIKHLLCARNRAKANRVKPAHPLLPQPSKTFRFPRCLGRCQWWEWFQSRLEALSLTRWLTSSWRTRKEKWKGKWMWTSEDGHGDINHTQSFTGEVGFGQGNESSVWGNTLEVPGGTWEEGLRRRLLFRTWTVKHCASPGPSGGLC